VFTFGQQSALSHDEKLSDYLVATAGFTNFHLKSPHSSITYILFASEQSTTNDHINTCECSRRSG
jgi:hypothetical protein